MCGRYCLISRIEELVARFNIDQSILTFEPHYNIAPNAIVPIVIQTESQRLLAPARWGLLPSWAKDSQPPLINARIETFDKKLSFQEESYRRRCIVPATGFFEWKREGAVKAPFFTRSRDGELLALAGIWEQRQGVTTMAVVTTASILQLQHIHSRMPMVLDKASEQQWLNVTEKPPFPAPVALNTYRVTQLVNSAKNNHPSLIDY